MQYKYVVTDGILGQRYNSWDIVEEGIELYSSDEPYLFGRRVVDGELEPIPVWDPVPEPELPSWLYPKPPQSMTFRPEVETVVFLGTDLYKKAYIKAHKSLPLAVQLNVALGQERSGDQEGLKRSIKAISSILRKLEANKVMTKASHTVPAKEV